MNGRQEQTIAAIATAQGLGGVAVIRISGDYAVAVAERVFSAKNGEKLRAQPVGQMVFGSFDCGDFLDHGYAVRFAAPHSYTGEHIVELHCHGGAEVPERLLKSVLGGEGVRLAERGEFTRRAFLNGKMDLTRAEGVADLIHAESAAEARAADRLLSGELGEKIRAEQTILKERLAEIEVLLDYPEEDLPAENRADLLTTLCGVKSRLLTLADTFGKGNKVRTGITVALCGRANAGKSSLLNCLLGEDRAIVSAIPGTTRDVVEGTIELGGVKIRLLDTAGIRSSADELENVGMERSVRVAKQADLVLHVHDDQPFALEARGGELHVRSKADLSGECAGLRADGTVVISSKTGEGVDALRAEILRFVQKNAVSDGLMITNERHYRALLRAADALQEAVIGENKPLDLVAFDLRAAWEILGEITGECATEDLLDTIFSKFCLGK